MTPKSWRAAGLAAVVLVCLACNGDGGFTVGEPDRTSQAGLTIDEGSMRATVIAGEVDVDLTLTRRSPRGTLAGTVTLALLDLQGEVIGQRQVDFAMVEGDETAEVSVLGVPGVTEGTAAGDLAQYVVCLFIHISEPTRPTT